MTDSVHQAAPRGDVPDGAHSGDSGVSAPSDKGSAQKSDNITCPHCGADLHISARAYMPPTQRMSFAIKHEHPLLSMKTVYGTLEAIEKLLRATAKDMGQQCHVFLENVEAKPGETTFHLFIADHDVKKGGKAADSCGATQG